QTRRGGGSWSFQARCPLWPARTAPPDSHIRPPASRPPQTGRPRPPPEGIVVGCGEREAPVGTASAVTSCGTRHHLSTVSVVGCVTDLTPTGVGFIDRGGRG